MTEYDVYLESDGKGRTMAHVLDLPGCFVRADRREAALSALTGAIRDYNDWLRRHGEAVDSSAEPIILNVAETSEGIGPFDPGDKAALFAPERRPLGRNDLERTLQLAAYNRADLLALVRPLPDDIRQWRAHPDAMSIKRALRHIGNAEQWYVSRLVQPDTLPSQWADDEDMALFDFLEMTRRTAAARMRQLSDEELSRVVVPQHFADLPDEPWTARKALRRLLEHEREHTGHIREILATWRLHLLARLAAERASFLRSYISLNEETLATSPVVEQWTAKDLLAHVGVWDAFQAERMSLVLDGRPDEVQQVGGEAGMAARNAELYERYCDVSLEQALAICLKERSGFLATLARVPDVELHRELEFPGGGRTRMAQWAEWRYQHDAEHAGHLTQWRETLPQEVRRRIGPKYLLRAYLRAARKEFLAAAALVSPAERNSRPVCGVWSLKDLVGHLTDWEKVGVDGLQQLVAGDTPEFDESIPDFDTFNARNATARRDQSWDEVWADFEATRQVLLDLFDKLTDEELQRTFVAPWNRPLNGYVWMLVWPGHDQEHAIDLRGSLQLLGWPERLVAHE
ncbi:MAG TPA: DinB family protein [Anaerolineae bacterium]